MWERLFFLFFSLHHMRQTWNVLFDKNMLSFLFLHTNVMHIRCSASLGLYFVARSDVHFMHGNAYFMALKKTIKRLWWPWRLHRIDNGSSSNATRTYRKFWNIVRGVSQRMRSRFECCGQSFSSLHILYIQLSWEYENCGPERYHCYFFLNGNNEPTELLGPWSVLPVLK